MSNITAVEHALEALEWAEKFIGCRQKMNEEGLKLHRAAIQELTEWLALERHERKSRPANKESK